MCCYSCLTACAEQPHGELSPTGSTDNPRPVTVLLGRRQQQKKRSGTGEAKPPQDKQLNLPDVLQAFSLLALQA